MAIATDRRAILAAGATLAAAAATRALAQPAGLATGAGPSKLFRTTEIASGKVMGMFNAARFYRTSSRGKRLSSLFTTKCPW